MMLLHIIVQLAMFGIGVYALTTETVTDGHIIGHIWLVGATVYGLVCKELK